MAEQCRLRELCYLLTTSMIVRNTGGNAVADIVVFGQITGENAARFSK